MAKNRINRIGNNDALHAQLQCNNPATGAKQKVGRTLTALPPANRELQGTGSFSQRAHDFNCILVENKRRNGEAKVLEVLTDTEKVSGEVIVEHEVIDFALDSGGGDAGIIPQAGAVADFGVEPFFSSPTGWEVNTGRLQRFFLRFVTKATKGR